MREPASICKPYPLAPVALMVNVPPEVGVAVVGFVVSLPATRLPYRYMPLLELAVAVIEILPVIDCSIRLPSNVNAHAAPFDVALTVMPPTALSVPAP